VEDTLRSNAPFSVREVLEPHVERLHRIARRILGCEDLAWDAVQEAAFTLFQQETLPPDPPGWLVKTVVHRSIHARRCRRRQAKREARVGAERACCHDPDPACNLQGEELRARLDAAIQKLADEYREVFILRELEGLDYAAIAREVCVPIGTVRSRLSRARSILRDALEPDADELF